MGGQTDGHPAREWAAYPILINNGMGGKASASALYLQLSNYNCHYYIYTVHVHIILMVMVVLLGRIESPMYNIKALLVGATDRAI